MSRKPELDVRCTLLAAERDAVAWLVAQLARQGQLALVFSNRVGVKRRSERPYDLELEALWSDGSGTAWIMGSDTYGRGWLPAECVAQFARMGLARPVDRRDQPGCWATFATVVVRAQAQAERLAA